MIKKSTYKRIAPFLVCFLLAFIADLTAQLDDVVNPILIKYRLVDGTKLVGHLIKETDDAFMVSTQFLGEIELLKRDIIWKKQLSNDALNRDKNGYLEDTYNSVRNIVTPSAFTLKKKQLSYENMLLGINSFSYGITDRITINFGFEAFSLLIARNAPGFFISPKINFPIIEDKLSIAAGLSSFGFLEGDYNINTYTNVHLSYGGRNNNISIGSGYGLSFDSTKNSRTYPVSFSAMWRLLRNLSIVTDNVYLIRDGGANTAWVSAVARIHFEDIGASFSFGGIRPTEDRADLLLFPFLSVLVPIN